MLSQQWRRGARGSEVTGRGREPRDGSRCGPRGDPQQQRGASRRLACAGRLESGMRERRGARTPPGSESGAGPQGGHSGTGERQSCPGHEARKRRGPGCTRALARTCGFQPCARRRRHPQTGSSAGLASPAPRAAVREGRLAVVVAHRPEGWWAPPTNRQGGEPRPTGPPAEQASPGRTTVGGEDRRARALTHCLNDTSTEGRAGASAANEAVPDVGAPARRGAAAGRLSPDPDGWGTRDCRGDSGGVGRSPGGAPSRLARAVAPWAVGGAARQAPRRAQGGRPSAAAGEGPRWRTRWSSGRWPWCWGPARSKMFTSARLAAGTDAARPRRCT